MNGKEKERKREREEERERERKREREKEKKRKERERERKREKERKRKREKREKERKREREKERKRDKYKQKQSKAGRWHGWSRARRSTTPRNLPSLDSPTPLYTSVLEEKGMLLCRRSRRWGARCGEGVSLHSYWTFFNRHRGNRWITGGLGPLRCGPHKILHLGHKKKQ